ncbi:MAG: caspase family protein, partial [Bacteroidales bacterium]|nr:caspase family protein [Bacteroidales bacterium]
MNTSRKYIIIALLLLLGAFSLSAQVTKRALVIGIDIYKPENASGSNSSRGTWTNLDGCVNDALSIKATLISKYGFTENNITFLANDKATKNDIINSLKNLIATSKKGDIVFIYYAGHGSQIKNVSSQESDGKDETMVPADAYTGTSDIRDKELNELFYQLAEKGVILTIIYDSCHSGSIGRGLAEKEPKSRYLQPVANAQVDDPSTPHNLIEKNVLIISAAQDFETAKEQVDEQNNPHGAFTFAFLQALKTLPANSPAIKIFESIRAVVKYNGKSQEPVFEGNETRRNQSIIGTPRETISNTTTLAVLKNESKDNITLQGGYISGVNENCILQKIYEKDTVELQIVAVNGANSSAAKIIKGNFSLVKAGDMFEVTKWTFSGQSSLKIYIPSGSFDLTSLADVASKIYNRLKSNEKINIVSDLASANNIYTIYFNGESWILHKPGGDTIKLGKIPAGNFVKQIPDGSNVFVSLPAFKDLKNLLIEFYKTN